MNTEQIDAVFAKANQAIKNDQERIIKQYNRKVMRKKIAIGAVIGAVAGVIVVAIDKSFTPKKED